MKLIKSTVIFLFIGHIIQINTLKTKLSKKRKNFNNISYHEDSNKVIEKKQTLPEKQINFNEDRVKINLKIGINNKRDDCTLNGNALLYKNNTDSTYLKNNTDFLRNFNKISSNNKKKTKFDGDFIKINKNNITEREENQDHVKSNFYFSNKDIDVHKKDLSDKSSYRDKGLNSQPMIYRAPNKEGVEKAFDIKNESNFHDKGINSFSNLNIPDDKDSNIKNNEPKKDSFLGMEYENNVGEETKKFADKSNIPESLYQFNTYPNPSMNQNPLGIIDPIANNSPKIIVEKNNLNATPAGSSTCFCKDGRNLKQHEINSLAFSRNFSIKIPLFSSNIYTFSFARTAIAFNISSRNADSKILMINSF